MGFLKRSPTDRSDNLVLILLLAGVCLVALVVDTSGAKPFRDEKIALYLWASGAVGLILAFRSISGVPLPRTVRLLAFLFPLLCLAATRLGSSLGTTGVYDLGETGFSAQTDYILRQYAFALAAVLLWLGAASLRLTEKRCLIVWTVLVTISVIEIVAVGVEILGEVLDRGWHPFLAGVFVAERQSGLKTIYFGSLGNSNFLAGYLAILFFVVLARSLVIGKQLGRLLVFVLTVATGLEIVLCRSKGALLGLLVGAACFVCLRALNARGEGATSSRMPHRAKAIGVVVVCLLFLGLCSVLFFTQTAGEKDKYVSQWLNVADLRGESLSQRILLAYAGLEMWKEAPWLGIGPGEFRLQFLPMLASLQEGEQGPAFKARVERLRSFRPVNIHNDFLQMLVEWGIVGYASFAAFVAALLVGAARAVIHSEKETRWFRIGALSGCVAGLTYALFEFPLHLPSHLGLLAVLSGWLLAPDPPPLHRAPTGKTRRIFRGLTGASIAAIALYLLVRGTGIFAASEIAGEAGRFSGGKQTDALAMLTRLKKATQLDPGNAEWRLKLAAFQWELQDQRNQAVETLRRGGPLSDDPLFRLLEAEIWLDTNQVARANQAIAPLRSIAPYLPGVGFVEGRIAEARGAKRAAMAAYSQDVSALAIHPEIPHPQLETLYLRYAMVLEDLGYDRDALRQYEKLVSIAPDYPLPLVRMGRVYRDRIHDYPTARGYLQRALEAANEDSTSADSLEIRKELEILTNLEDAARSALPVIPEDPAHH